MVIRKVLKRKKTKHENKKTEKEICLKIPA